MTSIGAPLSGFQYQAGSATIDASGGTITADYGRLTLTIPAGALSTATAITVTAIDNYAPGGIGAAYRFTPDGQTFAQPVTITLKPFAGEAEQVATMAGAFQTADQRWKVVGDATYDSTGKTYSFQTTHFTDYSFWSRVYAAPFAPVLFSNETTEIDVGYYEEIPDTDGNYIPVAATVATNPGGVWSVNGNVGGNGLAAGNDGTVTLNGGQVIYTAPASPPATQPLAISGTHTLPDNSQVTIVANVHVLAHAYTYEVNLEAISSCPGGGATSGPTYGFDINNPGTIDVNIDNLFQVGSAANPSATNATVTNYVACVYSGISCSSTMVTPVDGALLSSATGGFDFSLYRLHIALSGGLWTDTPGSSGGTCAQSEVQEPIDALAPLPTYFVGYDGESITLPSTNGNHATNFTFTLHVLTP